jgi:uncharacterized protein (DUF983 family)
MWSNRCELEITRGEAMKGLNEGFKWRCPVCIDGEVKIADQATYLSA